jgi:hypothetical protein
MIQKCDSPIISKNINSNHKNNNDININNKNLQNIKLCFIIYNHYIIDL